MSKIKAEEVLLIATLKIQNKIEDRYRWCRDSYADGRDIIRWKSEIKLYQECLNIIKDAREGFVEL